MEGRRGTQPLVGSAVTHGPSLNAAHGAVPHFCQPQSLTAQNVSWFRMEGCQSNCDGSTSPYGKPTCPPLCWSAKTPKLEGKHSGVGLCSLRALQIARPIMLGNQLAKELEGRGHKRLEATLRQCAGELLIGAEARRKYHKWQQVSGIVRALQDAEDPRGKHQ